MGLLAFSPIFNQTKGEDVLFFYCSTVVKSELMAKLDKEVKSLDEDSWMFDGPRSRINLISRPRKFLNSSNIV